MKYFEATAVTPYCGEELTGFYMAESEEKLRESGELDRLIEDCVVEWFDADEYDTYGFDSPEDYEEYVIKNYIRCGAIPKKDLIVGETYLGDCRNASEAIWNGKVFVYKRTKFGYTFDEEINHFEDDNGFDLFVPIKEK
jgi:hypothetical protein